MSIYIYVNVFMYLYIYVYIYKAKFRRLCYEFTCKQTLFNELMRTEPTSTTTCRKWKILWHWKNNYVLLNSYKL